MRSPGCLPSSWRWPGCSSRCPPARASCWPGERRCSRSTAWSLHDAGDPRRRGLGRRQGTCGAGRRQRPGREITAQAGSAGLSANACVRYLSARHEHLCYDQALANGWPIATGVIEGACRHLADRLDIGGARWGLDGAEAVLTLRAVISNGDFEEYWPFHLEREHQRLYPGIKQGQYALGA